MTTYDVVIGGSGINGLSVAAYLAKAGLSVCVLEERSFIGGGVISEVHPEAPGVIHNPCSAAHPLLNMNPLLANDELGLKSKYGLKYVVAPASVNEFFVKEGFALTIWKDIDKTLHEIATKVSEKEADNYKKMFDYFTPFISMMTMGMFNPPAPASVMNAALASMGEKGQDLARIMLMSGWDICCEWLETDIMRETITRAISESMISPFLAGTGAAFISMCSMYHEMGIPTPIGGSQKVTDAFEQCILDLGGTIRTNAKVTGVKVVGGKAKAFVLEDGEEVEATRCLVSTFHVKQLFGEDGMVSQDLLSDLIKRRVKHVRTSEFVPMLQNITLKEAPRYKLLDDQISPAFGNEQSEGLKQFRHLFNAMSEGEPSPAESSMFWVSSTFDTESQGPNGEHTLYLYNYEPYALYGDGKNWDIHGQGLADDALNAFMQLTTNISESSVVSRRVRTPLDFERFDSSWIEGDFCHLSQAMDQGQANRPFPEMSNYRTPIEALYMGGASTWPGPTVLGGGRAVAQIIFEDLGLRFDDVISG
jgi:phytoene dehydrogenase-like protein